MRAASSCWSAGMVYSRAEHAPPGERLSSIFLFGRVSRRWTSKWSTADILLPAGSPSRLISRLSLTISSRPAISSATPGGSVSSSSVSSVLLHPPPSTPSFYLLLSDHFDRFLLHQTPPLPSHSLVFRSSPTSPFYLQPNTTSNPGVPILGTSTSCAVSSQVLSHL